MYGLVNRALQEVVIAHGGEECWERVARRAGHASGDFISIEGYPDELTYALVGAASEELAIPAPELLRAFGVHWVLETARKSYGPLLDAGGTSLREFLVNLPSLHARISLIFPHLRPPEFVIVDAGDQHVELEYHSGREGLAPFVVGLLEGLGEMFETPVTVEQTGLRDELGHDVFVTRWRAMAGATA
jgi:hypothetical protein